MPGENADPAGTKVAERQAGLWRRGAGSGTVVIARDSATAEERGPQVWSSLSCTLGTCGQPFSRGDFIPQSSRSPKELVSMGIQSTSRRQHL